ncbi:hypothetical protein B0J12DRAFT_732294 [Macrophomina phaseolina]|uniref:Uncharacterized protein n=1 Tax=Macrophomina phaseolina TaxID=35725 RepID=A0ABQ8FWI1_9PEZI|nr:hypothetical protein B0J12DRAFT_732294 [Macrophomina phaseolina]
MISTRLLTAFLLFFLTPFSLVGALPYENQGGSLLPRQGQCFSSGSPAVQPSYQLNIVVSPGQHYFQHPDIGVTVQVNQAAAGGEWTATVQATENAVRRRIIFVEFPSEARNPAGGEVDIIGLSRHSLICQQELSAPTAGSLALGIAFLNI